MALRVGLSPALATGSSLTEVGASETDVSGLVWLPVVVVAAAIESNMAATEGDSSRWSTPLLLPPFCSELVSVALDKEEVVSSEGVTSSFSSALSAAANPSSFPPIPANSVDFCCLVR